MKFKLFGRLRDDEDGDQSAERRQPSQSPQNNQGSGLSGGSLERTVKNMSQQGYSEDEIKQELSGQYSSQKIDRAMTNAVTDTATAGQSDSGPEPLSQYSSDQNQGAVSPMDQGYNQNESQEQSPGQMQQNQGNNQQRSFQQQGGQRSMPQQSQMQQSQDQQSREMTQEIDQQASQRDSNLAQGEVDQEVEELIETIVAENLERVKTEFENVYEELDAIEDEVEDLEQRVHDLEIRDDEDQQEFLEKMDEIEQHIDDYESRIGGLEKAFQQVLPSLVDNVRDLTSLVQEIKQERGIETETSVSGDEMEDMDMENW